MTYDGESWLKRSRFLGAMRYHRVWLGRVIIWVLALLLAGNAVMICAALAGVGELHMNDLRASLPTSMALLLVCACLAAHSRTRFLLRFGTARFPVWLSNVLALFLGSAAFLLGTLAINLATGGAVQALSYAMPGRFGLGEAGLSLRAALEALPQQLLWLLEWTSLFYLLGCCLRRRRGVTLAVILGVPFVCFMLMLMPFVSETTAALENRLGDAGHGHGPAVDAMADQCGPLRGGAMAMDSAGRGGRFPSAELPVHARHPAALRRIFGKDEN